MTKLRGLRSDGRFAQCAVFRRRLDRANLVQVDHFELLIFCQWRGISCTFSRFDPFGRIRARKIGGFTAIQFMIEDVVTMKVNVPTVHVAIGDFHSSDIADFVRAAKQILDTPMAAGLAPNLLRHPDHVLERVRTLMTHRQRAEHHAPAVSLAMFHDRFHVIEAGGLNLVIADRTHPHRAASLQATQTAAVLGVPKEADTSGIANRTAALARACSVQHAPHGLPLRPTIRAQFGISRERSGRGIGGRITCIAIKGGYAARFTDKPRNVAFRAFPRVCYTLF